MKPTLRGAALAATTGVGSLVALCLALEAGLRIFPGLTPRGVYAFLTYVPGLNSIVLRPPGLFYNKIRLTRRERRIETGSWTPTTLRKNPPACIA